MPLEQFRRGYTLPGLNPNVSTVYDSATVARVLTIFGTVGYSELGIRFPYHMGSTTVTIQTSNTTLNAFRNTYDTLDIRGCTVTAGVSPIWIACRRFVMDATAILDADGKGGLGGAGGVVGGIRNGSSGQAADLGVGSSSLFRSIGGGGGGGGGVFTGGFGNAGNGGAGGRGGPNNSGGSGGNAGVFPTAGGDGSGSSVRNLVFDLVPLLMYSRGGAGGGGGGAEGGDSANDNGSAGANGGGGILITCEELDCDPSATIRARGQNAALAPGGGGEGGAGGGGWVVILAVRNLSSPTIQVSGGSAVGNGGAGAAGFSHVELVHAA
jgi:hypothetical protein